MFLTKLTFGKYAGMTLAQVLFKDPGWFFWAYDQRVFRGLLVFEAEELHWLATHIKVAPRNGEQYVVECARMFTSLSREIPAALPPQEWPHEARLQRTAASVRSHDQHATFSPS